MIQKIKDYLEKKIDCYVHENEYDEIFHGAVSWIRTQEKWSAIPKVLSVRCQQHAGISYEITLEGWGDENEKRICTAYVLASFGSMHTTYSNEQDLSCDVSIKTGAIAESIVENSLYREQLEGLSKLFKVANGLYKEQQEGGEQLEGLSKLFKVANGLYKEQQEGGTYYNWNLMIGIFLAGMGVIAAIVVFLLYKKYYRKQSVSESEEVKARNLLDKLKLEM